MKNLDLITQNSEKTHVTNSADFLYNPGEVRSVMCLPYVKTLLFLNYFQYNLDPTFQA